MRKVDIFFIVFFSVLIFSLGFQVAQTEIGEKVNRFIFEKKYTPDLIPNSESEIINNCKNLNLANTIFCVRDNVETFYFYNQTEESYSDIETLKKLGGDCYNYAMFYDRIFKELGFYSQAVIIQTGEDEGHLFTVISNNEVYCTVDSLEINCLKFDFELMNDE